MQRAGIVWAQVLHFRWFWYVFFCSIYRFDDVQLRLLSSDGFEQCDLDLTLCNRISGPVAQGTKWSHFPHVFHLKH